MLDLGKNWRNIICTIKSENFSLVFVEENLNKYSLVNNKLIKRGLSHCLKAWHNCDVTLNVLSFCLHWTLTNYSCYWWFDIKFLTILISGLSNEMSNYFLHLSASNLNKKDHIYGANSEKYFDQKYTNILLWVHIMLRKQSPGPSVLST